MNFKFFSDLTRNFTRRQSLMYVSVCVNVYGFISWKSTEWKIMSKVHRKEGKTFTI